MPHRDGHRRAQLDLVPGISLKEANRFVELFHRTHKGVRGCKFVLACARRNDEQICGVVIVGRPVARHLDDGWTLEVNRTCTSSRSACRPCLYGAAWRVARAMGYRKLITYLLAEDPGTSLKAAGWHCLGARDGGTWSREGRPRVDLHPIGQKQLWEAAV